MVKKKVKRPTTRQRRARVNNPTHKTKTETEMKQMLARVAELERRGYTQHQIATEVGVSQPMVYKYLKKIRDEYAATIVEDRKVLVEQRTLELKGVMREAWEALERSKSDEITVVTTEELEDALADLRNIGDDSEPEPRPGKSAPGSKHKKVQKKGKSVKARSDKEKLEKAAMVISKIVTTRKGRLPGVEYLNTIMNCIWKIAVLQGLVNSRDDQKDKMPVQQDDWWSSLPGMRETTDYNQVQGRLELMLENRDITLQSLQGTSNPLNPTGSDGNIGGNPQSQGMGSNSPESARPGIPTFSQETPVGTGRHYQGRVEGEIVDAEYVLKHEPEPDSKPVKDPSHKKLKPKEESDEYE